MATKRKGKNTGGKALIITFVCLIAVTIAVFGAFFGYDKYERSTHPMLYSDWVNRYSSQYKLDKYVVYSFKADLIKIPSPISAQEVLCR